MILTIVATIAIVAVAIALGVVLDRKLGILPKPAQLAEPRRLPAPTHAAGDAPAAAIRAHAGQLERLRATQRCRACRAPLPPAADEVIRYDDRRLIVLHFACPACAATRALYVDVRPIS